MEIIKKLPTKDGDWFKVRYLRYDDPGHLVMGHLYNAAYGRSLYPEGRVKVSKWFAVVDDAGEYSYCDNDEFEIVTEPESGLGFTLKPGTYIEPQE